MKNCKNCINYTYPFVSDGAYCQMTDKFETNEEYEKYYLDEEDGCPYWKEVKSDFEYIKVGDTIYTQDDDKQGWTGREEK